MAAVVGEGDHPELADDESGRRWVDVGDPAVVVGLVDHSPVDSDLPEGAHDIVGCRGLLVGA